MPGVGLALGVDRIVLAGGGSEDGGLDVYVVVADPRQRTEVLAFASTLRRSGLRVDFDPEGRSVKAQFKQASRRKARTVLVLGENEAVVTVRDMDSGEQHDVPIQEVQEWL